jgi:hypothetical protein
VNNDFRDEASTHDRQSKKNSRSHVTVSWFFHASQDAEAPPPHTPAHIEKRLAAVRAARARARGQLTLQQKRFIAEYLKDLNGKRAAMRIGIKEGSASALASKWLARDSVRRAVAAAEGKRLTVAGITAERVLLELARCAFVDGRSYFDVEGNVKAVGDRTEDQGAALAGFEVLIKNAQADTYSYGSVSHGRPRLRAAGPTRWRCASGPSDPAGRPSVAVCRHAPRPVRDPLCPRRRRDGRGVSRARHALGSHQRRTRREQIVRVR